MKKPKACRNRQAFFRAVVRAEAITIVQAIAIDTARPQRRIRDVHVGVATVADRHHASLGAVDDAFKGHGGEGGGHHLVQEVRFATAQLVGQIHDRCFLPGKRLDLLGE